MQTPFLQPLEPVPGKQEVQSRLDEVDKDAGELIGIGYGYCTGIIRALTVQLDAIIHPRVNEVNRQIGSLKSQATRFLNRIETRKPPPEASTQEVTLPTPTIVELPLADGSGLCRCAIPFGWEVPPNCKGTGGTIIRCDPITGEILECHPWDSAPGEVPPGWCLLPPPSEICPPGMCGIPGCPPCPPEIPPPEPVLPPGCCPPPVINVWPPSVKCESTCTMPDKITVEILPDCTPHTTFGCCVQTVITDCLTSEILPPIACPPNSPPSICVWPQNCDKVVFTCNVPLSFDAAGSVPSMDSECGQLLWQRHCASFDQWTKYAKGGDYSGILNQAGYINGVDAGPPVSSDIGEKLLYILG